MDRREILTNLCHASRFGASRNPFRPIAVYFWADSAHGFSGESAAVGAGARERKESRGLAGGNGGEQGPTRFVLVLVKGGAFFLVRRRARAVSVAAMATDVITVSREAARRFHRRAVLLDAPVASVAAVLAHHGYVQIDPINV